MAGLIPMSIERLLAVNSLPANMKANTVWNDQQIVAMRELGSYLDADYWTALQTGTGDYTDADLKAGELTVARYTYVKMMPFLNLNSVGSGFTKKTGIEENSTEIMSFSELKQYKQDLELQSLKSIQEYLTIQGYERLKKLSSYRKSGRCCRIGGVDLES